MVLDCFLFLLNGYPDSSSGQSRKLEERGMVSGQGRSFKLLPEYRKFILKFCFPEDSEFVNNDVHCISR